MASERSEVVWVASETASKGIARDAGDDGAHVQPRGKWTPGDEALDELVEDGDRMEPLTAVGLVVATGWLVGRLSKLLSDHLRPESQIVDLRETPPTLISTPHVKPPGTLVVIKLVNGEAREERYPPEDRDRALEVLPKLFV